jgi:acetate---CoA ligase (ADP-forming) subunit beta
MTVAESVYEKVTRLCQHAHAESRTALLESEGKEILQALGYAVPNGFLVESGADLTRELAALRPPYALKASSRDVIHKSDYGAVRLGLRSQKDILSAMVEIRESVKRHGIEVEQFLLEEMADPGVELVVGGVMDPEFGPMIMLGIGGIFVEIYKDVVFRICPIDRSEAIDMVKRLKGEQLLNGARGHAAVDVNRVVDCLLLLGGANGLMMQPQTPFAEIDINPFIATSKDAVAVDARFVLRQTKV